MGTPTATKRPPSQRSSTTEAPLPKSGIFERLRKPSGDLSRLGICIYGKGGMGKTTLLGTMPGRGLVIDIPQVEGGTSVLADKADKIDVLPVVRWEEFDQAYKTLFSGEHPWNWVAIDTITAVQELTKRRSIKDRENDLSQDPHLVTMQDWGKIGQLNSELIYKLRTLKIHTIILAQERKRDSNDGTGSEFQPDVSPATLSSLFPSLHLVGRLYVAQVDNEDGTTHYERRLRVGPHQMFTTKARSVPGRELPPVIKEPNLAQILAYMMGKEVAQPEAASDTEFSPVISVNE